MWIDRSLQVGEDWADTIEDNLAKASGVIVVLSTNSIASNWVQHEGSIAYGLKKPMYPLLISELSPEKLPIWASKFQYHSFVNVEYQAAFASLVSALAPAKNPIQILFNLTAALFGGVVGGIIGGAISFFIFQEDKSIMLGSMLVPGVLFSVPISIGISTSETFWKKYKLLPVIGGSIMGMLSGLLLSLLIGEIIQNSILGFIFGGGIALSVILGRRFNALLRIPIWVLASALTGWIATMSAVTSDTIPFIVVSVGVTVAIGLASSHS